QRVPFGLVAVAGCQIDHGEENLLAGEQLDLAVPAIPGAGLAGAGFRKDRSGRGVLSPRCPGPRPEKLRLGSGRLPAAPLVDLPRRPGVLLRFREIVQPALEDAQVEVRLLFHAPVAHFPGDLEELLQVRDQPLLVVTAGPEHEAVAYRRSEVKLIAPFGAEWNHPIESAPPLGGAPPGGEHVSLEQKPADQHSVTRIPPPPLP